MIVPFDTQRELFMGTEHLRAEDGSKQEHPAGGRNTNYICGLFKGLRYNLAAN